MKSAPKTKPEKPLEKAPPKQQESLILSIAVKLICVTASMLAFSSFAYLFNEVYIKETALFRYTLNMLGFLVAGALLGVLIAPHAQYGIEQLHRQIVTLIRRYPAHIAASTSIGVAIGMAIAVLASMPIYLFLPKHRMGGLIFFTAASLLLSYIGALIFSRLTIFGGEKTAHMRHGSPAENSSGSARPKTLDSSAILDGRLYNLCSGGFIEGKLLVPTIVLNEIQKIADDSDSVRRQRGRAGLETLEKLREKGCPIEIVETEAPKNGMPASVDSMLVDFTKSIGGVLVTNDYNLAKIAELRDVAAYNLNVIANTLRKTLLPGEIVEVNVVKYGKEVGQGIAYLDDGAMIVIESGDKFIGENVLVEISSIMQTVAGRLIFARIPRENSNGGAYNRPLP